jgi:hypothetical protein
MAEYPQDLCGKVEKPAGYPCGKEPVFSIPQKQGKQAPLYQQEMHTRKPVV